LYYSIFDLTKLELKLDLHVHSVYSPDGFNTIDFINHRINQLDLHGYALADHDTINGHMEAKKKAGELTVLTALEVSAKGAHILALDPTEIIPSDLGISETVDRIHEQGATAILAHPYALPRSWIRIHQIEGVGLDAIEVANSAQMPYKYIYGLNLKLAERLDLPITGGSDSHIPETIGRAYTMVETDSSEPLDVIKAIKLGRTQVFGSKTRITEWFSKKLRVKKKDLGTSPS
jgi:predicted metal-dependent phosphoesterase TrpH